MALTLLFLSLFSLDACAAVLRRMSATAAVVTTSARTKRRLSGQRWKLAPFLYEPRRDVFSIHPVVCEILNSRRYRGQSWNLNRGKQYAHSDRVIDRCLHSLQLRNKPSKLVDVLADVLRRVLVGYRDQF